MPTQGGRSEATRTKLLGVARKLFRARGYADTSLDDIAARAGVTKGAFYHHFEDKKAIFTAVFEEAERQLVEAAAAGGGGGDVWSRFRAGCRAFLEASMDPGIQRVALHDAPVVLGWEVWREIAARHSLGVIEAGLTGAMAAGQVRSRPTKPLARLLFGGPCGGAGGGGRARHRGPPRRHAEQNERDSRVGDRSVGHTRRPERRRASGAVESPPPPTRGRALVELIQRSPPIPIRR